MTASAEKRTTIPREEREPSRARGRGAAGTALDVLLTDAAVGNPAKRALRRPGLALGAAFHVARDPVRLVRRGTGLAAELARIAAGRSEVRPAKSDRRFKDPAWDGNFLFRRLMQTYVAIGETVDGLIDDAGLDWQSDQVARFLAHNAHDLLSPTNFAPTNPTVIKETIDRGGGNLVKGARRAARDVRCRRLPAMVDTSKFEVGGNLALTEGSVVVRTEVFELIQYKPTTEEVYEIPVVVVPPTINKYYILDLAPGRSVVEHLVGQGQQVFMISWRNPDTTEGHFDFDTYAAAIAEAREAAARITGQERVHVAGACSGGILSAGLLGHLAAAGSLRDEVASLTLMVCALDSERAGTTQALMNRELAAAAVGESARKGYLDGQALANVFAWLRPNDLVWGYVVNNYLLGKAPPAFDILYWNQDGVRLAAGLHRDFVHMALENALVHPGGMEVLGTGVDLGRIDVDAYVIAGLNDHIVPWVNAYRGARLLGGDVRFVLSTSGHIQALVNPPGPQSRSSFRVRQDDLCEDAEEFVAETPTTSGSWWTDYVAWLAERSGDRRPAPKKLGDATHRPLAKAPGSYVHAS